MLTTFLIFNLSYSGETVTGNHYQVAFGGKGANRLWLLGVAVRISRLLPVRVMTALVRAFASSSPLITLILLPVSVIKGESTGVALIFVNGEGENVIGIHAGANAALSRRWWKRNVSILPTRQHYQCSWNHHSKV